jgi:uncharacterized protein
MSQPAVVDAHTHLLPAAIAGRIRAFFDRHMAGPLVYPAEPANVVARHRRAGIAAVWTLPYAHRRGVADWLNPATAELVDELDGPRLRVVGGCTAHPDDPDPGAVVDAGARLGLRLVKLHCSVGDYEIDDPRLEPVWEAAAGLEMPVVLHLGHGVSGHSYDDEVLRLDPVAAAHEHVRFIVAHAGHPATPATARLLRRHPNVFADLTPVITEPVDLSSGVFDGLEDRLLFGTDAPNTALDAADQIARVRSQLAEGAAQRVLSTNAQRLVPL